LINLKPVASIATEPSIALSGIYFRSLVTASYGDCDTFLAEESGGVRRNTAMVADE
jgi:hypothetical protein